MDRLNSNGYEKDGMVVWILSGHQIDFTREEFNGLIFGIKDIGLFTFLEAERPTLKNRLISILEQVSGAEAFEEMSDEEKEFILEQSLFDLNGKMM